MHKRGGVHARAVPRDRPFITSRASGRSKGPAVSPLDGPHLDSEASSHERPCYNPVHPHSQSNTTTCIASGPGQPHNKQQTPLSSARAPKPAAMRRALLTPATGLVVLALLCASASAARTLLQVSGAARTEQLCPTIDSSALSHAACCSVRRCALAPPAPGVLLGKMIRDVIIGYQSKVGLCQLAGWVFQGRVRLNGQRQLCLCTRDWPATNCAHHTAVLLHADAASAPFTPAHRCAANACTIHAGTGGGLL